MSRVVSSLQPLNMPFMYVTFSVLKFETSMDVSPLHPSNIKYM